MNTPIPSLMKQYGTEDVLLAKTAGAEPLLARLGMSILNFALASSNQSGDVESAKKNEQKNEAVRQTALAEQQPARENLRHTQVPAFVEAGSRLPPGLDEGMVRLASIAIATGADRAKTAGIGDFIMLAKSLGSKAMPALKSMGTAAPAAAGGLGKFLGGGRGLKTNLALGATAVGGTMLASKAMAGAGRVMSQEVAPATYGGPVRGIGTQLPNGVNQYGVPQVGTPLG